LCVDRHYYSDAGTGRIEQEVTGWGKEIRVIATWWRGERCFARDIAVRPKLALWQRAKARGCLIVALWRGVEVPVKQGLNRGFKGVR